MVMRKNTVVHVLHSFYCIAVRLTTDIMHRNTEDRHLICKSLEMKPYSCLVHDDARYYE